MPELDGTDESFRRSKGTIICSGPQVSWWTLAISSGCSNPLPILSSHERFSMLQVLSSTIEGSSSQPLWLLEDSRSPASAADPEIPPGEVSWDGMSPSGEWSGGPIQALEAAAAGALGQGPEPTWQCPQGLGLEGNTGGPPERFCCTTVGILPGRPASKSKFSVPHEDSLTMKCPLLNSFSTSNSQREFLLQLRVLILGGVQLRNAGRRGGVRYL